MPEAQGVMARNFISGHNGFKTDNQRGLEFTQQAAEGGDHQGQLLLGCAYMDEGNGVQKDYAAALKWLELAAEQGSLLSLNRIGYIYDHGGPGVKKDK